MLGQATIDQIAVFVTSYAGSLAFYKEILGLRPVWESPADGNAGFRVGFTLLILQEAPDQVGAGGVRVYFTVAGIAAARERLLDAGVECSPVHDLGDFTIVNFADPDGNRLALFEPALHYLPVLAEYLDREIAL
jgi:catechol 2,3-dioxygenase-like lactoylglutathione lyase family enzyme